MGDSNFLALLVFYSTSSHALYEGRRVRGQWFSAPRLSTSCPVDVEMDAANSGLARAHLPTETSQCVASLCDQFAKKYRSVAHAIAYVTANFGLSRDVGRTLRQPRCRCGNCSGTLSLNTNFLRWKKNHLVLLPVRRSQYISPRCGARVVRQVLTPYSESTTLTSTRVQVYRRF